MKLPIEALDEDEQKRYARKRGVELDSSDEAVDDCDAGADAEEKIEQFESKMEAAEQTPPRNSLLERFWLAVVGTFYVPIILIFDLEVIDARKVSYSPYFYFSNSEDVLNWSSRQINPGGRLHLAAEGPDSNNKWIIGNTWTPQKDNVTFEGDGFGTYLQLADGADADMVEFTNRSNLVFRDMRVDGNRANQSNSGQNDHPRVFVSLGGSDNIHFKNLWIHDASNSCINFEKDNTNRSTRVTVSNCVFNNNADISETGYRPGEDLIEFKSTEYTTVTGCLFRGALKDSLEWEDSKHGTATGNVFENTSIQSNGEAIFIQGTGTGDSLCEDFLIAANTFTSIGVSGEYPEGVRIDAGRDVVVTNNSFTDIRGMGVRVAAGGNGTKSDQIVIADNNINIGGRTATGIQVMDVENDLTIADNQVLASDRGIWVNNCTNASVTGNTTRDTGRAGLLVNNGAGKHHISDNRIESYGVDTAKDAVVVQDPSCTVRDNDVHYNTLKAYNIGGTTCTVVGNWSDASRGDGFRSGSFAADTLVRRNDPQPISTTYSSDSTIQWSDSLVLVDASSSSVTVTLPDPAKHLGARVRVKAKDATNTVTVSNNGTENIDGANSQPLSATNDSYVMRSDGTIWHIEGGVGA